MHKGSCLCGAVSFVVNGELGAPDACHCSQCRKQSGHYFVSANVPRSALEIQGADKVVWYQSSEKVRRGFCGGSTLFWDPVFKDWTAIAMGALDTPTSVKLAMHIHVASKGDYYDIVDNVVQHQN